MARVTIKDLARELDISYSTVSRALSDHPDISAETKSRVMSLADRRNYRPNLLAKSLRTSRTDTIGVIVPDIVSPFFSALLNEIESIVSEAGYLVTFAQSHGRTDREVFLQELLAAKGVDGIIIWPANNSATPDTHRLPVHRQIPTVHMMPIDVSDATDNEVSLKTGKRAAESLLEKIA